MRSLAALLVFTLVGFFVVGHAKPSPNEEESILLDAEVVGESDDKTVSETETVDSKLVIEHAKQSHYKEESNLLDDVAKVIGELDGKETSSEKETVKSKQVVTEKNTKQKQEDSSLNKGGTKALFGKEFAKEINTQDTEENVEKNQEDTSLTKGETKTLFGKEFAKEINTQVTEEKVEKNQEDSSLTKGDTKTLFGKEFTKEINTQDTEDKVEKNQEDTSLAKGDTKTLFGKEFAKEINTQVTEEKVQKNQEDSSLTKGDKNIIDKEIITQIQEQAQSTTAQKNGIDLIKAFQNFMGSMMGNFKKIASNMLQNQKKDETVVKVDTNSYDTSNKGFEQSATKVEKVTEKTSEMKTTELENKDGNSNLDLHIGVPIKMSL